MSSLRRIEAAARSAQVRPISYSVRLDLGDDPSGFAAETRIAFTAEAGSSSFLDVHPRQLTAAVLNGVALDIEADFADGRLQLGELRESNELVVDAVMAYSHDGEGMVRHVDPADGRTYLYAMSFLDAAPRWFACFDQPDLKAPFTLEVSCPPDWIVAGNGPAVQSGPGRWTISQPRPVATYMTTLVAGPYHSVHGSHDGIPLAVHARASLAEFLDREAAALFEHTGRCFDELHRLFGMRYPWGDYHQAFVPDFNAGAMENPGCVTFRDQMIFRSRTTDAERVQRNNTIAHEMAHMWFGDVVTMRWWDDLWLNESFAEYLAHRVCDALGEPAAWVQFGVSRKGWGYAADRRPSTHPVAGNGASDAAGALNDFDGISYAKGAATLRQLATRLGDDVFLAGLRGYIATYAFGNAELADLLAAWSDAGASGITEWADQWLRTSGMDTLRVDGTTLVRIAPAGQPVQREHAITVATYPASERAPLLVAGDVTELPIAAHGLVLPDAGDETWAKIALSQPVWAGMAERFPAVDPIARVVVWNALKQAVADAEVDPALAVRIVAAAVPSEEGDVMLGDLLAWVVEPMSSAYLIDPGPALDVVRTAVDAALAAAAPGSGRQLAAMRGVVATSVDVARLVGLLAGDLPAGVVLEPDLRWRLVARLCALGHFGLDDVEAELAADDSTEGAEHAARCRALVPTAQAKAAAWQLLMHDTELSAALLYATARGFWHRDHAAFTEPYVARYFDEILGTAQLRSGWVVGQVARLAYPHTAVSTHTLALAEELLARRDLPPGIARSVVDCTDDLRRAVTARARLA
ncbi:MAG TPA: aminopeptidase N [Jatrophihabitantaceae bacterium]|nr:aminopeptidase N [Jatrophihabitantaceae bacterium]